MKSVRLNEGLRRLIVDAALNALYADVLTQLTEQLKALDDTLYRRCYTPEAEAALAAQINICTSGSMRVDIVSGNSTQARLIRFINTAGRPFSASAHVVQDDTLYAQYQAHNQAIGTVMQRREAARVTLYDLLESCSTTKQLLAVWPEAQIYLVHLLPDEASAAEQRRCEQQRRAGAVAKLFVDAGYDTATPPLAEADESIA